MAAGHKTITLDKLMRQQGGSVDASGAVIAPDELARAQARRIDELWRAADAYQAQFFSGGIFAQMYQIETLGSKPAKDNHRWIFRLWRLYYSRKAQVMASGTVAAVNQISTDYASTVGVPPYTVAEIMAECGRLLPDLMT